MNKYDPLKNQIAGGHYVKMVIQPVEYIQKNGIGFIEGNIIKYVSRWRDKNGIEDLKKARHYIELLMQLEQTNGNKTIQPPTEDGGLSSRKTPPSLGDRNGEDPNCYKIGGEKRDGGEDISDLSEELVRELGERDSKILKKREVYNPDEGDF